MKVPHSPVLPEIGDPPPTDEDPVRRFLEKSPLYAWEKLDFPIYLESVQPLRVEGHCGLCARSRPFISNRQRTPIALTRSEPEKVPEGSALLFPYFCTGCSVGKLDFLVEFTYKPTKRARKVGQRPPISVAIPKDLAAALGPDDAELFRKAKVSLAQGYGIGACAYLRRLLEHQVNPILALLLEARRNEGAPEEELEEIRRAVEGKAGDEKMRLAYQHAPRFLVVDGSNPLKLLYGFLSGGIHERPEDKATTMATAIEAALVVTLRELGRAKAERAAYTKAIRDLGNPP